MFNNSIYTARYYKIVDYYKTNIPSFSYEKHHILPRSLGGSDDEVNMVKVPYKAHYLLHKLLIRMCDDTLAKNKMKIAFVLMARTQTGSHINSRKFQEIKVVSAQIKRPEMSAIMTELNRKRWVKEERSYQCANCKLIVTLSESRCTPIKSFWCCQKKCYFEFYSRSKRGKEYVDINISSLGKPANKVSVDNMRTDIEESGCKNIDILPTRYIGRSKDTSIHWGRINGASNGKKGAEKLSKKVIGRKIIVNSDGSRTWFYPDKS